MIMNSRGKDFEAKQEGDHHDVNDTNNKYYYYSRSSTTSTSTTASGSSSRQWGGGFRNPRIVRVSRSFGGKDRHSKVCTVRGLRDRRIRLSVPTAIQLYDLQDRLGLGQPSKVVDWLLDATKTEIDKLPPLQMPPAAGNFPQFHHLQAIAAAAATSSSSGGHHHLPPPHFFNIANPPPLPQPIKINDDHGNDHDDHHQTSFILDRSKYWIHNPDAAISSNRKDQAGGGGKDKWIINAAAAASNDHDHHHQEGTNNNIYAAAQAQVLTAQNFFPLGSFPTLLNNALPNNPFYHWDPAASNLSLAQLGGSHSNNNNIPIQQTDDHHEDSNVVSTTTHDHHNIISSSMTSLAASSHHQLYFCPSGAAALAPTTLPTTINVNPSILPAAVVENIHHDPRQINHFQFLSSSSPNSLINNNIPSTLHLISSPLKPLTLNVNPHMILRSQENNNNNKGGSSTAGS